MEGRLTKIKVCILGAGIGGLTAAHYLSKQPDIEVHIYERNDTVGGQARSSGGSFESFSEYCWHVVGDGYLNLIPLLQEIPDDYSVETNTMHNTVFDHLIPINNFLYGRYSGDFLKEAGNSFISTKNPFKFLSGVRELGEHITFWDFVLLFKAFGLAYMACEERLEGYSDVLWSEFMKHLSPEAKRWVVDSPSIYLGMKTDTLSTQLMLSMFRSRKTQRINITEVDNFGRVYPRSKPQSQAHFYSFSGPINEVWFQPWVSHLKKNGVIFHMSSQISEIFTENDKIIGIRVDRDTIIKGDIFVNALSVESLAAVIPSRNFSQLSRSGRQIQTQVLYKIPSKVETDGPTIIVLPDTEWCIMVRIEGELWRDEYYYSDKDILCAGIGIWERPGVNGKTAQECTREEIAEEVWRQIQKNEGLMKSIRLKDTDLTLADLAFSENKKLSCPPWDIWESYRYDDDWSGIQTYEPKFTNGVGTLENRPQTKDAKYKNLYHSTAYTRTDMDIFCMESAVEAGVRASGAILMNDDSNPHPQIEFGWFWNLCQTIDKYLLYPKIHPFEFIQVPESNSY